MPEPAFLPVQSSVRSALSVLILGGIVLASGCGSLSSFSRKEQVRQELESNPKYSIGGVRGPTERALNRATWNKRREQLLKDGDAETTAALSEFDAAQALYDAGKFKEAEKAFLALSKERRNRYESMGSRFRRTLGLEGKQAKDMYGTFGDAIEEDALFMLAESQFAQKRYAYAQNSYDDLLVRYPSTRYLDETTRRLFNIARYWLGFPEELDDNGNATVKVASHEDGEPKTSATQENPHSALDRVPVLPNLTDKTRPLFDTYGRGLQALRSIWLHDATGPLADDALMLAANHHLRTEDFVEASRLYTLLREQYPDSPHLRDAYLLGSVVTLASYQGPAYDGQTLEQARELKEEMLALFPTLDAAERARLKEDISLMREAEIARDWDLVEFYRAKRDFPAMKLHCYLVINRYPESKYAEKARETLKSIEGQEEAWAKSPFNFRKPKQVARQPEAPTGPAGEVHLPDSRENSETPSPEKSGKKDSPEKPGLLQRMNPLRRLEQPPRLEQTPPTAPEQETPSRRDDLAGGESQQSQVERTQGQVPAK